MDLICFFFFIGDFHISGGLALCFILAYHKCHISSIFGYTAFTTNEVMETMGAGEFGDAMVLF